MLDLQIDDEEHLFRAVLIHPDFWKEGRPSSAVFKDSIGASVDRQGNRDVDSCITFLHENRAPVKAIVYLKAGVVRSFGAHIKYDPIDKNEYHSLILKSETEIQLSSTVARRLAKACYKKVFVGDQ